MSYKKTLTHTSTRHRNSSAPQRSVTSTPAVGRRPRPIRSAFSRTKPGCNVKSSSENNRQIDNDQWQAEGRIA